MNPFYKPPVSRLGRVIILVDDYDKAFEFYRDNFGCRKLHDSMSAIGKRYLHVAFPGDKKSGIWFLQPETDEGRSAIGRQTEGQPTLVIYTEEIDDLYAVLKKNKVTMIEDLQATAGSKFFHCLDLYGNRLTVVELLED